MSEQVALSLKHRIQLLLDRYFEATAAKLADEAGISAGAISKILNDRTEEVMPSTALKIVKAVKRVSGENIRREWVQDGEGPMRAEKSTGEEISGGEEGVATQNGGDGAGGEGVIIAPPDESYAEVAYNPENGFSLTIYRSVRPKGGRDGNVIYEVDEYDAERHIQSKRLFKQLLGFWPPDDMRGAYIDGDSMEPGLPDGQLVLYKPTRSVTNGKRYVFLMEDEFTGDWVLRLKRIQVFSGGGLRIISDNSAYVEDEVWLPGEAGEYYNERTGKEIFFRIAGQVLWPRDDDDAEQVRLITRTIERLAMEGMIKGK